MQSNDAETAAKRPRQPVLLVHGLGGFDQLRIELLRRNPICIDYFRGIVPALLEAGAPAVHVAALPPNGSIEQRAAALKTFIDANLGAGTFHVIAHSMGGLDSRHYITHLGGGERVISLTTLGTPHRGSALACISADSLLGTAEKTLGRLGLREAMERIRTFAAAHRDLRPADCTRFNEQTPDRPGVAYHSWGGRPDPAGLTWVLSIPHRLLLTMADGGPNDGLVTLESAHWTGWHGEAPTDHLGLAGWQFTDAQRRRFNPAAFYRSLLPELAGAEEVR